MGKWEDKLLDDLGESGIKIVLFLFRKGDAILSDFKKEIGMGYEAIYRSIATLIKYGLIVEKEMHGNVRCFELSEKGKRIAEKIWEAEQIMLEK